MAILDQIRSAFLTGIPPDLGRWSYLIIAILVFMEGPAVTLVAAAMAATGILRADLVFIAAAIGNFLADSTWYGIGYMGGRHGIVYRMGWFSRWRPQIETMETGVQAHGPRMYLMAKLSLGLLTVPTLLAAGLVRVAWWRLLAVSIFIEPIWTGMLVFAGYNLGAYLARFERDIQIAAVIGGVLLLAIVLGFYRRLFRRAMHIDSVV